MQMADEAEMRLAEQRDGGRSKNYVKFYQQPKPDEEATLREGRPICKPVEYVRIQIPGDKTNILERPATAEDRHNYRREYEAYKDGKPQEGASGTLLPAWGGVPPERVLEYELMKVYTVEQLAGLSDGVLQNFGPGTRAERQRADDYIKSMKGYAPVAQQRKAIEDLTAKNEAMERQLLEQSAAIAELRRGRAMDAVVTAAIAPEQGKQARK